MKFLTSLFLILALSAGTTHAVGEAAFVDLQEVFKRFYKTQLAQDQMRQQADDIKLERDGIQEEVKEMREEIETLRTDSRDVALSDDVRANKRDQLEVKLVELQKKEQDAVDFEMLRKKQMEQQNARMTKKIFDEIHEVIIKHAKAKGYASVMDRSSKSRIGTDVILYANSKFDITADVLSVLNEGRESKQSEDVEPSDSVSGQGE